MRSRHPRLAVLYEHPEWFRPLFAALDRRGVAYDAVDVSAHRFDPEARSVPWTLVLNRMSPSAHRRGHGHAIAYTHELLRHLEALGAEVVNGSRPFALETSKVSQLRLLGGLGLRAPRSLVIDAPEAAPAAAEGLAFPVLVKPNIGGSGAGIQRFDTPGALAQAVAAGAVATGIDGVALVQELLPARGEHIVRVEVLDGRILYAIKVYLDADGGFNLCPADICHDGEAPVSADLCPVDLPRVALRVEGYRPPAEVASQVLRIADAAGFDLGGVEYLVNDRDGQVTYYDINVLSNFVTDAVRIVGFDPHEALVDYLVRRGRRLEGVEEPVSTGGV